MLSDRPKTYLFAFSASVLGACVDGSENDSSESPAEFAAQQLTREQEDGSLKITPDSVFLEKNSLYKLFAARVLQTNAPSGTFAFQAARFRSQALTQTLYPQFRPSASINEDGDPVGRLAISQIVYSNGKFQADKENLRAGEVQALAEYLIAANQSVADGLSAYFEIDYHRQLAKTASQLEQRYTTLVAQALRRVEGGVGDGTEVETFKLKMLEARSDFQENAANQRLAEDRVRDLTAGLSLPASPPLIQSVQPASEAPELVLLYARSEAARSVIAQERAKRRPSVSIEAFTENNFRTGQTDDGVSLGVGVSVPLGINNGLEVQAAEAELAAIDTELSSTRNEINRRRSQLRASIRRDTSQIVVLNELVAVAEGRVEKFDEQFLSGSVSIEEAVSILETYKRSKLNLVEARRDILAAKVEIARTNGQLVPSQ